MLRCHFCMLASKFSIFIQNNILLYFNCYNLILQYSIAETLILAHFNFTICFPDETYETKVRMNVKGSYDPCLTVYQASYCVLLHMIRWIPSRPNIEGYELDTQLIVPAVTVAHIIGRHGRHVRQMQSYSGASIWMMNSPQPPPTPTGANRSRVKITGNFWQIQVADAAFLSLFTAVIINTNI